MGSWSQSVQLSCTYLRLEWLNPTYMSHLHECVCIIVYDIYIYTHALVRTQTSKHVYIYYIYICMMHIFFYVWTDMCTHNNCTTHSFQLCVLYVFPIFFLLIVFGSWNHDAADADLRWWWGNHFSHPNLHTRGRCWVAEWLMPWLDL